MKTFLAQNEFITNSGMPNPESAVASKAPPVADATAAPIPVSPGGLLGLYQRDGEIEPSVMLAWAPGENLPPAKERRCQEAPAGSAPNTAAPAGALVHWEGPWWLVLLEVLDLPPIELTEELPLFIRDGLHLRRWEA